ncbi:MAG TPA: hypothetical protein VGQ49_05500 [Bryobacteraceae bacterium]|nr:hypothetical protein [Bryobacteraceae bacterium]
MLTAFLIVSILILVSLLVINSHQARQTANGPDSTWAGAPPRDGSRGERSRPSVWHLRIPANSAEFFTPEPLLADRVYRLTFSGTFAYRAVLLGRNSADAVFKCDAGGNYKVRHACLLVEDHCASKYLDLWSEHRANHVYTGVIDGYGMPIAIRFQTLNGHPCSRGITAKVELLPEGTPTVASRREAAEAAAEAAKEEARKAEAFKAEEARLAAERHKQQWEQHQQKRKEEKRQAAEAAREQADAAAEAERQRALDENVMRLVVRMHHNRNFLDDQFCEQYVRQQQTELLAKKTDWMADYHSIMHHSELVEALKNRAPEVLEWLERRVEMLNLAERLSVFPPELALQFKDRRITGRTIWYVEQAVSRLFQLRQQLDEWHEQEVLSGFDSRRRQEMKGALRVMDFKFEFLKMYGITASTPEEAEDRFVEICPVQPVSTLYEKLWSASQQVRPSVRMQCRIGWKTYSGRKSFFKPNAAA